MKNIGVSRGMYSFLIMYCAPCCHLSHVYYCNNLTKPVTRSESLFFSSRRRADQSFGQIQLTRSHSTVDMVIPESIRWSFCNFISHNPKFYDINNRR